MPINPSLQRKLDSMKQEVQKIRDTRKATQTAMSDKTANDIEALNTRRAQILDAEKQRLANAKNKSEQFDATELVQAMINEAYASGGFDYEKDVNDKLKKHGRADPDSTTAGSSGDAPDAKFKHNGKEHNLEVKKDHNAMFGQIELKHDGKKWGISDRSKAKYPETAKSIEDTGFLHKVNKQWDKPTGDYESDLQKGNVYHMHADAEPIKSHYGKDRNTPYIQIGGGHGFYHTGEDKAKLGSPELEGKTQLRARMKARGRDADGKRTYGALIVMSLKNLFKSHHDLDAPVQKEWIEDSLKGHKKFMFESDASWAAAKEKEKENNLKPKDKKTLDSIRAMLGKEKKPIKEARGMADKHWSIAQRHKEKSDTAHTEEERYHHLSNYHDSMSTYHSEMGKHTLADAHGEKAEIAHDKSIAASKKVQEAHKIGDKVEIIKGSDKGIKGRIGEIRHGAYKGAPKTFTVFHGQNDATQVKKTHIKGLKEDTVAITEETECFSHGFWSGQQEEPKKNPYEATTEDYAEYENGYMQGVMTRRRMQVESHVEFRIDHRDKLTGDHKSTFTKHDAKVSDTTDKATYVKVPSDKADSFKSAMKSHGAKVELAEETIDEEGEGGVAANNAGDGKIAGFAGDAGKKVKMMSEPLKRKPMPKFKTYVSQEHENT